MADDFHLHQPPWPSSLGARRRPSLRALCSISFPNHGAPDLLLAATSSAPCARRPCSRALLLPRRAEAFPMAASSSFSHGDFPCSSLLGQQPGRPKPLCSASFFHLRPTSTFLLHGRPAAAPLPCSAASSSSPTTSSHGAQKFQQQGLPLLHSSSSSTLLSSLAQTSPMARCSRRPGASPPWLATRLPPCMRAAAQCAVDARCVLDEMRSKPRVVDFLQQPRRLRALWAHCFIRRSEQHAVDTRRLFAIFAQPHRRRRSPR
jgi:hypothetical protein